MKQYIEEAESLLMHTYNRYQIVLDHGDGVYLYDVEGKKYLDFCSGIAVFALGYGNQEYNDALKGQIDKILHTSNYFYNLPAIEAAKKLCKATGMDRVFFTSSGTEAIEGAIKLAKKKYYETHGNADGEIISLKQSFHGRSMGALAVTGNEHYREAFGPYFGTVKFATMNDFDSILANVTEKTCAIVMETVQGEGGIYPSEAEFLHSVRNLCDEKGIVLILDEIQCGMGRTGTMFAYEQYGVKPDIVTCAKALGCGVPIGAFVAIEDVAKAFEPGDHGTTYGGNPFATVAASKVFDLFESEHVLENVNEVGAYLAKKLNELVDRYDFIIECRGKGLMLGLEFACPVKEIIKKAMDAGLILISAGTNVIRFLPALVVEKEQVDEMIEILTGVLNQISVP